MPAFSIPPPANNVSGAMIRAGVALGSNLGERLANLRNARNDIAKLTGVFPPMYSSALYETKPVNCEPGAANFLNTALEFSFAGEPLSLLRGLAMIEKLLGRPSDHAKNVSRVIDLDLLYFGALEVESMELRLPHPRIAEREFVMRPLADVRPDLILPQQTQTVSELLDRIQDAGAVVRIALEW